MADEKKTTRKAPKRTAAAKKKAPVAKARKAAAGKVGAGARAAQEAAAPAITAAAKPAPIAPGIPEASPLSGRPGAGRESVVLVEHSHFGKVNLRGDAKDPSFLDAVRKAVGVAPPVDANTVATAVGNEILWLGPDEWLVVTPAGAQLAMEAALAEGLAGQHTSIADTSDNLTTIRIHGERARDVLAKGCPMDLHPRAFGPGRCAQSIVAKADVLLHQRDESPTYDLYVRCSFARYLWDWLVDAAQEFA